MNALQQAREYLAQYEYRIDQDNYRGDLESRTRYENVAYHQAMMHAAIAQAEELKRIADALEALDSRDELAESVRIFGSGDDSLSEFQSARKRASEQMDGMRRGMGLVE